MGETEETETQRSKTERGDRRWEGSRLAGERDERGKSPFHPNPAEAASTIPQEDCIG